MLMRIWLIGIALALVSCELTGEHVCEEEERYPVNITEFSLRNVTVRNYKWCMGFPPRCSFYTLKTVKVPEVVERLETRIVRKCCPGFAENVNRDGCVPCKKCFEGTCGIGGKCLCNSGFRGEDCADACESMRWGVNCQKECLCEHGNCNPRTGRCDCPTGWFGTRCEVPCLEGFYGKHCINRCSCGERDLCSPETGDCLRKKTRQQDHHSTRAIQYMTEDVLNITIPINKQKSTPSLTKYYTFDLELNNKNNTAEENEIIDELNIKRQNTKINNKGIVTSSSERRIPITKQYKSTTQAMSKNNNADKKYGNTLGSAEDSAESTTEMSSEIARDIENVAIVDENGSLEYHKKINPLDKSQEIIHGSFGLSERNKTEHKEKRNHTYNNNGRSRNESIANRKSESGKDVAEKSNKKGHVDVTRSQRKLDAEPYKNLTNIPVRNHSDYSTNVEVFNKNTETTSSVDTFRPVDVTLHGVEDIIPPTSIKPASITTPSSKGDEASDAVALEENELQNLDIINNILTSRETTTPSRPLFTTIRQNNALKKELLSFGDAAPSTKSIDMKNDLYPPESTENQISMKETYERRNGNDQIGGGVSEEYEYSTNNNSNITTHMSIVALVSLISVLILSGVILVHHYSRKRKTKKIDNQNYTGPTVSVYTHSIFHTPLPDPPIFENPVFKTPSEVSNDHRTFQTHVICSLNFPENKISDEKEYTYDHPPSTGSYRAASIPEPPEMLETLNNSEPVYDEIPSSRRGNQSMSPPPSYKSSCLYMNTCGKTRF